MTLSERTWQLMLEFCRHPSISATDGEKEMALSVHNVLSSHPWFRQNPQLLAMEPQQGAPVVWGLVQGRANNTIVLLNHYDVVDVDDYGPYRHLAFDPLELTRALDPDDLPPSARQDLLSGQWLFGRGTMDMKYGLALQLALTEELAQKAADLPGCVLFLSVPDEENMSAGMRRAVAILSRLQDKYGLNYIAAVDSEPHHSEAGNHLVQTGSDGKLLALLYCVGKETHAGTVLEGLNPHLLLAEVVRELELNSDFCDQAGEETTMPPTVLRAGDMKSAYNVSTPTAAWALINIFTLGKSPEAILTKLMQACTKAMERALNRHRRAMQEIPGKYSHPRWAVRVLPWSELRELAARHYGPDLQEEIEEFTERRAETTDCQQLTLALVHHVHQLSADTNPKILIAFAPPVYPPVYNRGESTKEKNALAAVARLRQYAREELKLNLIHGNFHRGISDLSYCALQEAEAFTASLAANFPLTSSIYQLPLEEMARLDMPVLNLGPLGRDFHKFTERLHIPSARQVTPHLLSRLLEELWQEADKS